MKEPKFYANNNAECSFLRLHWVESVVYKIRVNVLVPLFTAINLYCLMDLGDVRGCKWFIRFYYGLYVVTVVSVLRVFVFNFCYLRCVPMSNVLRIRFIFYINKKWQSSYSTGMAWTRRLPGSRWRRIRRPTGRSGAAEKRDFRLTWTEQVAACPSSNSSVLADDRLRPLPSSRSLSLSNICQQIGSSDSSSSSSSCCGSCNN